MLWERYKREVPGLLLPSKTSVTAIEKVKADARSVIEGAKSLTKESQEATDKKEGFNVYRRKLVATLDSLSYVSAR